MRIKSKRSLIGGGGMASEICSIFHEEYYIEYKYDDIRKKFVTSDDFQPGNEYNIAVGYPETKVKIINNIKHDIKWGHPIILSMTLPLIGTNVRIGHGSVIYPIVSLTTNIEIGPLATINNMVKIGHNCVIGEMFHASPGATVSGYVTIGDRVFLGANSCIKEYMKICDDVIIGAGAVVVKDITEPGKYAGVPTRKI